MTAAERAEARRRADALTPDALAALIRRAMRRRGVESQRQLSALASADKSSLCRILHGQRRVPTAVRALCALGLIREDA